MKTEDIITKLKKELDNYRFSHSIGVAYTGAALAMCYGVDYEKAFLAGLLHDCAKSMSSKERIKYCRHYDIELSNKEIEEYPEIIHAFAGSVLAREEYKCKDNDILSAIKYHTTGKAAMSLLEEIIFIADYIEPGRGSSIPGMDIVRREAFINLQKAIYFSLKFTMQHLENIGKNIAPLGKEAYDYYKQFE